MNTSINITHHRKRIHIRRWRRGLRIVLAGILLMCLLSACAAPVAVLAAETGTPPEMTDTVDVWNELPDNIESNEGIIAQEERTEESIEEILEEEPIETDEELSVEESAEPIEELPVEEPVELGEDLPAEEPVEVMEESAAEVQDAADGIEDTVLLTADMPMLTAAEPMLTAAGDTTWQESYTYKTDSDKGTITLDSYSYKYGSDPKAPTELTIHATAVLKGVTYKTVIKEGLFNDAFYIKKVTFEDGLTIGNASLQDMFRNCFSLEEVDFGDLNTSGVYTTAAMFVNCAQLRRLDLSGFDVSNVYWMNKMFTNCYRLESLNVSGWDTHNVVDMWGMFADCMSLKSLDLSSWSTNRCTGSYQDGNGMEGMFSVALEEITLGPEFRFKTTYSGLLGTWNDGSRNYAASEIESTFKDGGAQATFKRVSLGGTRGGEEVREQVSLTLPEGYARTEDLTAADKVSKTQRNGRGSDPDKVTDGQLIKTAEWTDKDQGEGDITLTYAVPSQGGARAVYAFGTCNVHGFGADVAITQILELLDHYDYVDALTTSSRFWHYYDLDSSYPNFLADSKEIQITLSAADGREANYRRLVELFMPDYTSLNNYNIINWGSHQSAVKILSYLSDYLKETTPAAIYVSCDGSRGFSDDSTFMARQTAMRTLYGVNRGTESANVTYDDLKVDADTMKTLAEYQQDGRYYVCICKVERSYTKAYYGGVRTADVRESKLICYASFALFNPYYFVHNNEELREYLSGDSLNSLKYYSEFNNVGREIINYGTSFTSQGIDYISAPLTMTDTVDEGLAIDKDHIQVSITLGGEEIQDRPDIQVTVNGQNVRIYIAEVSIGEVVTVHIPVTTAAQDGAFCTDDDGFRNTNVGTADVVTAAGKTVSTESPQLCKGRQYTIATEVVHGTITETVTNIPWGEDREITYAPEEGYHLDSITVDGASVDIEVFKESYAFSNITDDHVIRVVYVQDDPVPEPDPEPDPDPDPEPLPDPEPDPDPDPVVPETPEEPAPEEPEIPKEEPDVPVEEPETPTEEPETPNKETQTPTKEHKTRHHKNDSKTTESYQIVNTTVVNEPVAEPVETIAESSAVTEPVAEPLAADAGPATGDDGMMFMWLFVAGAAAVTLAVWIGIVTSHV